MGEVFLPLYCSMFLLDALLFVFNLLSSFLPVFDCGFCWLSCFSCCLSLIFTRGVWSPPGGLPCEDSSVLSLFLWSLRERLFLFLFLLPVWFPQHGGAGVRSSFPFSCLGLSCLCLFVLASPPGRSFVPVSFDLSGDDSRDCGHLCLQGQAQPFVRSNSGFCFIVTEKFFSGGTEVDNGRSRLPPDKEHRVSLSCAGPPAPIRHSALPYRLWTLLLLLRVPIEARELRGSHLRAIRRIGDNPYRLRRCFHPRSQLWLTVGCPCYSGPFR